MSDAYDNISVNDVRDLRWEQFSTPGIFLSVQNIAKFRLSAKLGYVGRWHNSEEPRRISQKLYYYLLGTINAAGFHDPQNLEIYYQEGSFRISYNDPEYGFVVTFSESGWIEVERIGSSLQRFHEWYVSIMPTMQGIISTLKSSVNEEIGRATGIKRSETDDQEHLNLQQAAYEFQVIAYNFRRSNSTRRSPNLEIMKRALTLLPDDDGRLADSTGQEPEFFGKLNYSVNRWTGLVHAKRREIYQVSAPSNNEWSSLWFTFTFIGDSYISPDGRRSPFNDKDFVSARGSLMPYVTFLRNRALCGFVSTLTDGYEFSTTPDVLP
jgi:hypothetical protein